MSEKTPLTISIGNISMGGTGKTPFTIFLAQYFTSIGEKVAVLSLGYKGGLGKGTNVISDGNTILYTPPAAADEPYMMAKTLLSRNVAVITGKDRKASYDYAVNNFGTTVFILDDCFQYRKMPRDVNILLLDYANPVSTGFPFPFGMLREFPSGIKRADIIVFTRAENSEVPSAVKKYCADKPVFFCRHSYKGFFHNGYKDTDYLKGKKIWVMSAIAGGKRFEKGLADIGAEIVGGVRYSDHHKYTDNQVEKAISDASAAGAEFIVTTQKDIVKISERFYDKLCYPMLEIEMLNGGLEKLLLDSLQKVRS